MDSLMIEQHASKFINNRSYPSNAEANDWLKKTSAVHKAIKGLVSGTLDVDQINLKKYGILNQKEQEEEDKRKAKVKQELAEREAKDKERTKVEERKRWWKDASVILGEEDDKIVSSYNFVHFDYM